VQGAWALLASLSKRSNNVLQSACAYRESSLLSSSQTASKVSSSATWILVKLSEFTRLIFI